MISFLGNRLATGIAAGVAVLGLCTAIYFAFLAGYREGEITRLRVELSTAAQLAADYRASIAVQSAAVSRMATEMATARRVSDENLKAVRARTEALTDQVTALLSIPRSSDGTACERAETILKQFFFPQPRGSL